jgi:phenylpropionate dioxygenase-like ring-hydroxylating dioxygenase large terminal subunit
VPEVGDYFALPHENEGRVLLNTPAGLRLVSNVCRHRQAVMLRGRGHTGSNIVCPLHRWTYDLGGQLIGAPHFADDPCRDLAGFPVQTWNGMVFDVPRVPGAAPRDVAAELGAIGPSSELDFTGYVFDSVHLHECAYNWKTFIEVYLEDYHVAPFHPGLGQFVTCEDLRWEFGPHHSVQTVGPKNELAKPGSPAYRKWHDAVLAYRNGRYDEPVPRHGAIWLTYYPATMVEWYPHVLVVSTLVPKGPQKTLNVVEFYYPRGHPRLRARVRRGRAGGVLGDLRRGRRDRLAHGRRPACPLRARRGRLRAVPEPDGRRHAAVPRVVPEGDALRPRASAAR